MEGPALFVSYPDSNIQFCASLGHIYGARGPFHERNSSSRRNLAIPDRDKGGRARGGGGGNGGQAAGGGEEEEDEAGEGGRGVHPGAAGASPDSRKPFRGVPAERIDRPPCPKARQALHELMARAAALMKSLRDKEADILEQYRTKGYAMEEIEIGDEELAEPESEEA
ncbi:hypothetical protein ACP4OV_025686 [Aristida adscensionis]